MTKKEEIISDAVIKNIQQAAMVIVKSSDKKAKIGTPEHMKNHIADPRLSPMVFAALSAQNRGASASAQLLSFNIDDLLKVSPRNTEIVQEVFDNTLYKILVDAIKLEPHLYRVIRGRRGTHSYQAISFAELLANIRVENRIQKRIARGLPFLSMGSEKKESTVCSTWFFSPFFRADDKLTVSSGQKRTNYNITSDVYSYKDLLAKIQGVKENLRLNDSEIATLILNAATGKLQIENQKLHISGDKKVNLAEAEYYGLTQLIAELTELLLVCEPMRYPATFITSLLGLYLVSDVSSKLTFSALLFNEKRLPKDGPKGGLIAMTLVDEKVVQCARYLEGIFNPYMPFPYTYEGDELDNFKIIKEIITRSHALVSKFREVCGCRSGGVIPSELFSSIDKILDQQLLGLSFSVSLFGGGHRVKDGSPEVFLEDSFSL